MSNLVISNSRYLKQNRVSLGFALVFSVIYYGPSRTRLSWTPRYLKLFMAPSSNQPQLSRTLLRCEETLLSISQEVQSRHLLTRSTESWEMYWSVHGKESKVRLTGLLRQMQKAKSFRCLRDKNITPEILCQSHFLEPPLSQTISLFSWEFNMVGFHCKLVTFAIVLVAVLSPEIIREKASNCDQWQI